MPLSFVCPTQHWMSIRHSHGHTHTLLHTQGQLQHRSRAFRSFYFCLSVSFMSSHSPLRCIIQQRFHSFCPGSQESEQTVFNIEAPTVRARRVSGEDGPLWLLCWGGNNAVWHFEACSICVGFRVASVLFVIRLLTRCESAADWSPAVWAEQVCGFTGFFFLLREGTRFDPSCRAGAINPRKLFLRICYTPYGSLFWHIHLLSASGERKYTMCWDLRSS